MGNSADRDRKRIDYAKRRKDALDMRYARSTYQAIADKLYNGNKPQAFRDIQKAIAELTKESAEEVRAQEVELLDAMARGLRKRALGGDDKAVASMLRLMERRAKYLGLDAPAQTQLTAEGFNIMVNPDLLPEGANLYGLNPDG